MSAKQICEQFQIPRHALYRLVREGKIRARVVEEPWRTYPKLSFSADEVAQDLAALAPKRAKP